MKLLSIVLLTLAFQTQAAETITVQVSKDADQFMRVARSCLSTPESMVADAGKNQVQITDASATCAKEIQGFASKWNDGDESLAAVWAKGARKDTLVKKITAQFAANSVTLTPSQNCPCLVLSGPKAAEAAKFAQRQ